MKRLFSILLLLIVTLGVSAQNTKNVLEIDQSSFRPVQTDVLKGVTIDAIKVDRSKRPCARIKMHVNRMTREEIDQIAVKTVGGMVELTKRITAAEGNGIIFELTAKPETRFYIHHDKYGDSNEVMVNLEGNKEYRIDAQLNMLLSITVASNTNDAEVYIDEVFKGRTANGSVLTVEDVTPGSHTLKLKYGSSVKEQTINVNSSSIFFRQEVDVAGMQPQWVVFEVEPKDAMIFVDNQPLRNNDGIAEKLFANGDYSWRVMAGGHHEQTGRFTVSGEKVELKVTLKPDGANVTITTDATSEIWVNNQKKGVGSWSGMLLSDTYIFEARKEGHRSTSLTQSITSTPHEQSYTIPAPTPIYGSLNLTSVPSKARLSIDGLPVGETPLLKSVLAGNHTLELSKDSYDTWRGNVTIAEGQTATVSATLTKKEATSSASATTASLVTSSNSYKVGDYYNDGKKEGVVFWVDKTGKHGKIVSLTESSYRLQWTSNTAERKRLIGANDNGDGAKNMAVVKQRPDWQSKYPAFKWCADLGEGWYLPAINELKIFTLDKTVYNAVNQTLETKGRKLVNKGDYRLYWSSTESNEQYSGEFCAWGVSMGYGGTSYDNKNLNYYVRAVSAVNFGSNIESTTTTSAPSAQRFTIAVSSNVKDAEVYIDNKFCGRIDNNYTITITDILEGEHTLRMQYNGNQSVQKITVNSNNIYFRCDVNTTAARPQYVIFALEPKNAIVTIDGATHMPDSEGYVQLLLLNGTHNYSVKAQGYHEESGTFTVSGAKVVREIMLRPVETNATTTTTTTSTSTSWSSSSTLGRTYKVGDYYNENGKQGVVFWVDSTGKHGKIVSLTESSSSMNWSSNKKEQKRLIGADDKVDGAKNMAVVKQISDWQSKYPAFKWCADLGEGWYLPAIDELKIFTLDNTVHDAVNRTLETKGKKLANRGEYRYYWSSTEYDYKCSSGEFCAWFVHMHDGSSRNYVKHYYYNVRAVSAF